MNFKVGEFYKSKDNRKKVCITVDRPGHAKVIMMDVVSGDLSSHTEGGDPIWGYSIISEWHDEPQDCPVCGHKAITSSFHCLGTDRRVICSLLDCSFSGPICLNDEHAIEAWNRLRSE